MTTTVIGLKGSPKQRRDRWRTLVDLRSLIEYDRSKGLKKSLDFNTMIYNHIFNDYLKAA